jgi:hypothetical protein
MHYYDNKKSIKLNNINFSFDIYYNDNTLLSKIPSELTDWINKQIDYTNNKSFEQDLFMLIINYSMKLFNYFIIDEDNIDIKIEKNKLSKIWSKLKIDYTDAILKLSSYIKLSPSLPVNTTVYCGISYYDYVRLNKSPYFTNNRFLSTTFDKLHAINYAYKRRIRPHNLFLLKIVVKTGSYCIYSIYENQIVFPPNTNIKLLNSSIIQSHYKDILNTELSKKSYKIYEINAEIFQ